MHKIFSVAEGQTIVINCNHENEFDVVLAAAKALQESIMVCLSVYIEFDYFLVTIKYVQVGIFFLAIVNPKVLIVIVYNKLSFTIVLQKMFSIALVHTKVVFAYSIACDSHQLQQCIQ